MSKKKLDWFKLDCQCDDKIDLIEAEFGLKGFAVVIKLYQKIYGGEGYFCQWNDDIALLFAKRNGVSEGAVREIVSRCAQRGIFHQGMLDNFGILTSHGIQKRYYDCTERRKSSIIRPEYALIQQEEREADSRKKVPGKAEIPLNTVEKQPAVTMDSLIKDYGRHVIDPYRRKIADWEFKTGKQVADPAAQIQSWLDADGVQKDNFHMDKYAFAINNF